MARKVKLSVDIAGTPLTNISSFNIEQRMGWHHAFELFCSIGEKENTLIEKSNQFIGQEMSVHVASDWYEEEEVVFKGIITRVALTRKQGLGTGLILGGYSPSIALEDGANCRSFSEKKLGDIFSKILNDYAQVEYDAKPKSRDVIPYVVQYKESNFHFLSRQANLYGEWWYYNGLKWFLGKPSPGATKTLKLGKELHHFDLGLQVTAPNFTLQSYDYLNTNVLKSDSPSGSVSGLDQYGTLAMKKADQLFKQKPLVTFPLPITSKSDLDKFALRKRSIQANKQVLLTGSSDHPFLKIGDVISVQGTVFPEDGSSMENNYGEFIIVEIHHNSSGAGNYQNTFKAITSTVEIPPANPYLTQVVSEAQVAVVVDNKDNEGLGRVKVRFNWQGDGDTTPFIRQASGSGGKGQGFYFVPEVDDEVMVGFVHGNPDAPYIIGSVYNSNSKPSGIQDNDNYKKSILTKSGNQILFIDEEGAEEIHILNHDNTIVFSMKESKIAITTTGNIELSGADITIAASGALSLSAGTDLKAEAKAKLAASGGSDASVEAPKVKIAASASGEFTAGAQMKVSGGAMTEISGAMVKIN